MPKRALPPAILWTAGALLFFLLATANSGGYRYGASDQAYYIPAIREAMTPALFPRDDALLDAQSQVILWDGLVAGMAEQTGLPLSWVFFGLYAAGVLALYVSATLVARAVGLGPAGTIALLALLTLRHRIAKTGVNTLEGYLHPRMIAYACGVLAIAAFVRGKPGWAAAALAACAAVHPTSALWFGLLLGAAAWAAWPSWRRPLAAVALAGAAAGVWAIAAGPLAPRAVVMDDLWLSAIATKDYLFPHEWPAYAWFFNFLPAGIVALALWRARDLAPELRGLLAGALALTAFFLATLPLVAMRYALAVQLQIPRVFWLVELMAFLVIAIGISRLGARGGRRATAAVAMAWLLVTVSVARGATVLFVEKEGELVEIGLPEGDWTDAMQWLRAQPVDVHVLADPGHAWRYGTSVRVAAERDVFLEDVKDAAIAMYDRDVAVRVVERRLLTHDLASKPPGELRALAARYGLHYLVTTERLDLPLAYENATFRIYALR
ncbi:MAG TPA: hypothetical protein VMN81_10945 [Vicinamibacterales bacterium]|nr:hypothetical protein [Vicinamibacterales bacterium]